ncbi:Protein O-mannosyl-transferase 1 [Entomortierella beljakovae]|nr:Protein O-mannosyl-transferase 1 [Entomortierella beljakovae]
MTKTGVQVQDGSDMWSWITSHRTVSDFQMQTEMDEDHLRIRSKIKGKDQRTNKSSSKEDLSGIEDNEAISSREENDSTMETEKMIARDDWAQTQKRQSFSLTSRDAKVLATITVLAIGIRFWRISLPDEVTLNEAKLGRLVNRYLTNEYVFDSHPPLASIIMAKIASLSNYMGTFSFDLIGEKSFVHV